MGRCQIYEVLPTRTIIIDTMFFTGTDRVFFSTVYNDIRFLLVIIATRLLLINYLVITIIITYCYDYQILLLSRCVRFITIYVY